MTIDNRRPACDDPKIWKSDWAAARRVFTDWWHGKGVAIHVTAPRDEPIDFPPPPAAVDLWTRWTDPAYRVQSQLHHMGRTWYGGVAFPVFDTNIGGPGSLGLFLGAKGEPAEATMWYEPCIHDPDSHPPLQFDPANEWFRRHVRVLEAARENGAGRYTVGCPDLIENLDTLVQLRGAQETMYDLVERPQWVVEKVAEINRAFFAAYEALEPYLRDPWAGTAFSAFALWGPGRTVKTQCDISCAMSPTMYRKFVRPALEEQCAWLDFALYHLDGTQALPQLDNLLEVEHLHAIEWTPQAGLPDGGSPQWYELYRRIRAGGKCVQAVGVRYDEVLPLIDAVGTDGLLIMTSAPSEEAARHLLDRVGWRTE